MKAKKKKPDISDTSSKAFKSWMISVLRGASYRWPARNEAVKLARRGRNQYECAQCKGLFTSKEIKKDHIDPVVDPKVGFVSWDTYIPRMFVKVDGFQILCNTCHDTKSKAEREERKKYKI